MKLLLTSTGFDNPNILSAFLKLLEKPSENAKALFIPTALNTPDSRKYVHVFVEDLEKANISHDNIYEYDFDKPFSNDEIAAYDIVFVCPGSPEFLLEKMNTVNFKKTLDVFLENGGVYVGVSAGSDVAANNFKNSLGYLPAVLETHAEKGSKAGRINIKKTNIIKISDKQAVLVSGKKITVIE